MAVLEEYRRKRDFDVTPEPAGDAVDSRGALTFVIQKHAATRMHWDFRIELDGVLLSWAVPKGPSLDTADKRLAMHVEDHPIEYGSFEGVIPKGEYGGGTVMLWDRGIWAPDHGDPREHLAQGHLKFDLYGERLRGRWMLVRTKGYGGSGKDSWLLFKERDDEARPRTEFDAASEWMTSVATGRTMEEIAADVQAIWHSDESVEDNVAKASGIHPAPGSVRGDARAGTSSSATAVAPDARDVPGSKRGAMPESIDVELASLVKHVPEGDRWFHEIKFDGYRILAFKDKDRVRLISRNGKDWTERFPDIEHSVAALPATQVILDGEVVVLKPDGSNSFQALQNFARRGEPTDLTYMVFDLLYLDGTDLRGVALEDRKPLLEALVSPRDDRLRYTDHIEGRGDVFFEQACTHTLEGVVSKRRDAPYRSGRSKDWAKTKCLQEQEFVIVGYTDPGGSRSAFGALVLAVHDNGDLKYAGRVGTGFSDASLADIHARLIGLERKEAPLADPPTGAQAASIHWVEPGLVAEVSFTEWTEDGHLRHPAFRGLREDKPADQVIAEEPVELSGQTAGGAHEPEDPSAADEAHSATADDRSGRPRSVGGGGRPLVAGVSLSNPDRVLWPDVGITKLELARYYESIAELMLPHVAHRPLSLVRCPSGYTGECFYQKHISHFPKAVGTVAIWEPDDSETVPYAKITGLPSIVGLVQMGVLEIHPWGSRADDPDRPDRLIFDLDPDTELPWKTVTGTALLIRSELSRLGLESWLKTTGGKGLHVVVPIVRRQGWTEVRDFSKAFVDHIVSLEPALFTASMSKSQRGGKIFIDYVRNTRGATAVAAYGARARPGAPVSVPLYWKEAESAHERPEFTVRNLAERLDTLGGDPWAGLISKRQSLSKEMRSRLGM